MAKSELVYEFQGSRNLNTTPIDITGLQGDTYDYTLTAFFENEGISSTLNMTFNSDTTANYRRYKMEGDGTSVNGAVSEVITNVTLSANAYTYSGLCTVSITGSSGDERYIDHLSTLSASSGDTRLRKNSSYWKNTADEITSIQLKKSASVTSTCHILLYRTLKTASQGNWEKVDELTWSAESSTKSFTVDGDRDKKYKIAWRGDKNTTLEINNDSGSNYLLQYIQNANGTISASNTTNTNIGKSRISTTIINAETGVKRLCLTSDSRTISAQQIERGYWYSNTATNITSLDMNIASTTMTGTATLYRMKSGTETDGVLNWELIEEVDVSGDFSSGYSFSGLTGDSEKLYRLEWLGESNQKLRFRPNNDSVANNAQWQQLRGTSSSTSASATTTNYFMFNQGTDAGEVQTSNCIIYPKSGADRPMLNVDYYDEDAVEFFAFWYQNTVDEITSIHCYTNAASSTTGKLKLWRLK